MDEWQVAYNRFIDSLTSVRDQPWGQVGKGREEGGEGGGHLWEVQHQSEPGGSTEGCKAGREGGFALLGHVACVRGRLPCASLLA